MAKQLLQEWNRREAAQKLHQGLAADKSVLAAGLPESARQLAAAELFAASERTMLVLVKDMDAANRWLNNLLTLLPGEELLLFPRLNLLPFEIAVHNPELTALRLQALAALAAGRRTLVIAPAAALVQLLAPPQQFVACQLSLRPNLDLPPEELRAALLRLGYRREAMVDSPGSFAVRGGLIDVFPIGAERPVRIDYFDTEIETMRYFDPVRQSSQERLQGELQLLPCSELPFDKNRLQKAAVKVKADYETLRKQLEPDARRNLHERLTPFIEWLGEGIWQDGMEQFLCYLYPEAVDFFAYLPADALLVLDEPETLCREFSDLETERSGYYEEMLESGAILPDFSRNYLTAAAALRGLERFQHLGFAFLPGKTAVDFQQHLSVTAREIPSYTGQLQMFAQDMKSWQSQGFFISFCASSPLRAQHIRELLRDYQLTASLVEVLPLSRGFEYPDGRLAVVTETELLGRETKVKQRGAKRSSQQLANFTDLKPGDLVVHENHGIGRYGGIERIVIDEVARDYLKIDYAGTDRLFVPVDQMDMVQKYIGNEGAAPKLYRLGGNQWQKVKSRARASVALMADELLKLYAERQQAQGFAFAPDNNWQLEFEDGFPFEETEGQKQAIAEIKADMESPRPMDRLLCGDVGYGKTEVAMRAAMKAVLSGKQVAMLVPTTLLAEQHYQTFCERFGGFPIDIGVISRFVGAAKQKALLERAQNGNLDILIGTHRLLSKDIQFKDLGLLIIDEEQRFGVAHKEKIKQWRNNIDVLTLSATPIPRTLHMSLVGMRDMSVIATPPPDRHPVQTFVMEYNPRMIREAIKREMERGGQVYFVHNRVHDMERLQTDLQLLVPEARILIAHGQLGERGLEKVMKAFVGGEADVLLCTTIAESGLDIPNANTLIVNNADCFGLAQLYQLRGRVGRSPRQAYAYFTYVRDRQLSEDAVKRLMALRDFSQLGSGFKIAMRDMEIRGAGNVLGSEQHGHIAAVGFEMYCKLVAEEVEAGLNQTPPPPEREAVQLDLGVNAYIPDTYLADAELKVEVYKRIALIGNATEKEALAQELADRFGEPPPAVQNLLQVGEIKALATRALVKSVGHNGRYVILRFFDDHRLEGKHLVQLAEHFGKVIHYSQQKGFAIRLDVGKLPEAARLEFLLNFLRYLLAFWE